MSTVRRPTDTAAHPHAAERLPGRIADARVATRRTAR